MPKRKRDKISKQYSKSNKTTDSAQGQSKNLHQSSDTKRICIGPVCGTIVTHQRCTPCRRIACPDFGARMMRER